MIRPETGEFTLTGSTLIIQPELSLSDFQGGDLRILTSEFNEATGYTTCTFSGELDALEAEFTIKFRGERLHQLLFADNSATTLYKRYNEELEAAMKKGSGAEAPVFEKWGRILSASNESVKMRHDAWLRTVTGAAPPYEYDWGSIGSEVDPHSAFPVIGAVFKYQILDREPGVTDIRAFLEARRRQSADMMEELRGLKTKHSKRRA